MTPTEPYPVILGAARSATGARVATQEEVWAHTAIGSLLGLCSALSVLPDAMRADYLALQADLLNPATRPAATQAIRAAMTRE
jgi:hypothetical protein